MGRTKVSFLAALSVFALLFFSRSFTNYFVADDFYFLGRIDLSNAGAYFTQSWGYGNEYRPLAAYSYALDSVFSGKSPVGYHATNTLLHGANAALIGLLLLIVGASNRVAMLASFLFLLNPVAHESVIWISGRPVILGSFFVLSACCCFVHAWLTETRSAGFLIAGYALFVAGLGTYEVAVMTPCLAVLACYIGGGAASRYRWHLVVLLLLTVLYVLLWNWLFDFKITRFPVEHSIAGAVTSFAQALTHSFRGSGRLGIAFAYLVLLLALLRRSGGWKMISAAFLWFFIAYLPFLLVQGYADRFGYLGSAATATVLALALHELKMRSWPAGLVAALILLAFFGIDMQKRITAWKEAGEISRSIQHDIKRLLPEFPEDRLLVLLNVPVMHDGAYVYFTGLDHALQLEYPGAPIRFTGQLRPWADESSIILEYSGGAMVRRQWRDVEFRYP